MIPKTAKTNLQKRWFLDTNLLILHQKLLLRADEQSEIFYNRNRKLYLQYGTISKDRNWPKIWNQTTLLSFREITDGLMVKTIDGKIDLRGIRFTKLKTQNEEYLYGLGLLKGCKFVNVDFSEALLGGMTFMDNYLINCKFHNTYFGNSLVSGIYEESQFIGCDFSNSAPSLSQFFNCNLVDTKFKSIKNARINFQKCNFTNCDFTLAELGYTVLCDCQFTNCKFNRAFLDLPISINSNYTNCSFKNVDPMVVKNFLNQ